jgi:hypothetical protein
LGLPLFKNHLCSLLSKTPSISFYAVAMTKHSRIRITVSALIVAVSANLSFAIKTNAQTTTPDIPEGIYSYIEKDGEQLIPFSWQAQEEDDGIAITVEEQGKTFYNLCTADGNTLKWHITIDGKHDLTAVRQDDTIHIEGIRFGEKYSKSVSIDERPWYQPLSFSLGTFLGSDATKTSFWVIRADKIEVIALTAEKMGVENVAVNGVEVPAQKIEVRADGFYSSFWHATYWYRKSDNLFLRYQSTHGLPGSEETIVELVKTPAQHGADS